MLFDIYINIFGCIYILSDISGSVQHAHIYRFYTMLVLEYRY